MSDAFPRLAGRRRLGVGAALAIAAVVRAVLLLSSRTHRDYAKPAALQDDLRVMRVAIDRYHAKHGFYPATLDDLVRDHELRAIPVDPMTGKSDWRVSTEETVSSGEFTSTAKPASRGIFDVHSSAPAYASY